MIPRQIVKYAVAATVLAFSVGHAEAATFDLNLTAVAAQGSSAHFFSGTSYYDQYSVTLSGVDSADAFTVAQGDTVNATVTFDGLFTIPASFTRTNFAFFLEGDAFPNENTGVSSTISLYNGSNVVLTQSGSTTTSGFLASTIDIYPPSNGQITFDSFTTSFNIYDLTTPASVYRTVFDYTLVHDDARGAVPEPTTWALMLVGFGGLGAALRSRRRPALAAF
jgi:hypothetical protein